MATRITAAGESLMAQLQAAGEPLVIDKFIFANVEGQNPADPIAPGAGIPTGAVVLEYDIPEEYRAFVNPNQVVYSALLGSDVGDFSFNWQGLYCSEHDVLIALSTFPPIDKYKTNAATGQSGNNITRNLMLEYTGAKEATGITVEAATWQLDFTVRLKGIDERERLSNRDIYGRASFLGDGWQLVKDGSNYRFSPGVGYVEGIRLYLAESLLLPAPTLPCVVWLDVALEPSGSDVAAVVQPVTSGPDDELADYTTGAPFNTPHYLVKLAALDASGSITELREQSLLSQLGEVDEVSPEKAGYAPALNGNEGDVLTIKGENAVWVENDKYEIGQYYPFQDEMPRPGMFPLVGMWVENFSTYHRAVEYFEGLWGSKRLVTLDEYNARHIDFWHTRADGSTVGWDGEGGVNVFVWDKENDRLLTADLSNMVWQQIGSSLGVGEVRGWGLPNVTGSFYPQSNIAFFPTAPTTGAFKMENLGAATYRVPATGDANTNARLVFDLSRGMPPTERVQPPSWLALACVYLGAPR